MPGISCAGNRVLIRMVAIAGVVGVMLVSVMQVASGSMISAGLTESGFDGAHTVLAWLSDTIEGLLMVIQDAFEGWTWA